MAEQHKPKRSASQDWMDQLKQLLNEINARNVILRRLDGSTILSLPGMGALIIALIIPQLAVILVIAHLLEIMRIEIVRNN
ncbi:MAG: hypothetical protein Kow0077_11410 [Anaerolineae bacterium]